MFTRIIVITKYRVDGVLNAAHNPSNPNKFKDNRGENKPQDEITNQSVALACNHMNWNWDYLKLELI